MDFDVTYTPEQEAFRPEVRAWLADNIPEGLENPVDSADLLLAQYQKLRELGRRLGAKGWLFPTYPQRLLQQRRPPPCCMPRPGVAAASCRRGATASGVQNGVCLTYTFLNMKRIER